MNCQFQNFGVFSILAFRAHCWLVELIALFKRADAYSRRVRHIYAWTPSQRRKPRRPAAYYAAIAHVDDQLGRLIEALRSFALAEDTIVILASS